MAVTTDKTFFFHIPRTGGTWVEHSLKEAFPNSEKVVVDGGWDLPENGIHIPPTKLDKVNKFTYTFVRHPWDWYKSYYQFLIKNKSWDDWVDSFLGKYTNLVKQFEQVDFVGKTENLYFDLCDALEMAEEKFDESKFHSQHINTSIKQNITTRKDDILKAETYVIEKYYG